MKLLDILGVLYIAAVILIVFTQFVLWMCLLIFTVMPL